MSPSGVNRRRCKGEEEGLKRGGGGGVVWVERLSMGVVHRGHTKGPQPKEQLLMREML